MDLQRIGSLYRPQLQISQPQKSGGEIREFYMKILLVSEYFYPHWTGIAKAFLTIANELKKTHRISVLTTRFDTHLEKTEKVCNINIYRIPYLIRVARTHYSPQTILRAVTHIKNNDSIIINSPHSNVLPIAIITKILRKKLYILSILALFSAGLSAFWYNWSFSIKWLQIFKCNSGTARPPVFPLSLRKIASSFLKKEAKIYAETPHYYEDG